ncbi:MAG: MFS transporter, partial [Alphaproteobacteria bacterium]
MTLSTDYRCKKNGTKRRGADGNRESAMDNRKIDYFITKPMEIVSLAALGTIGNLAAFALPVIVGGLVDHMALDTRQAGFLGTAEMIGLGLGAMLFSGVILKVSWRKFALAAVLVIAAANMATPFANGLVTLYGARLLSGLGGGMLLALGAAGLSSTRTPERVIGSVAIASMLFAAVVLYGFPLLLKQAGITAMFFTIAGINLALSMLVATLPRKSPYIAALEASDAAGPPSATIGATQAKAQAATAAIERPGLLIGGSTLSGIFLFFTGAMAFWVYIERVGVAAAFATEHIARVLGLSQIFGALGALMAVLIATRLGNRLVPMGFCIVLA